MGIIFSPIAHAAGIKEMRQWEGQACWSRIFFPTHQCCMIHGRTSAGGLSEPLGHSPAWRVWGQAQSGLTAKCPGTGGLGWIRQLISTLSSSKTEPETHKLLPRGREGGRERGGGEIDRGYIRKTTSSKQLHIPNRCSCSSRSGRDSWDWGGPWGKTPVLVPHYWHHRCHLLAPVRPELRSTRPLDV